MRAVSDFIVEMLRRRREDQSVEAILSDEEPEDDVVAGLSSALATLNVERLGIDLDRRAAEFAATAAEIVRSGKGSGSKDPVKRRLIPRLALAAMATVLVLGLTGVAVASDAARPGDLLYGLDRALERIGLNDGGLEERLMEAGDLANDGAPTDALNHVADALRPESANASDALNAAAAKLGELDPVGSPSPAVKEEVAAMLEWIANSDASGRELGQGVAERARSIGQSKKGDAPGGTGPPDDRGSGGNGQGGGNGGQGNGPPGGEPPGQQDR